MLELHKNFKGQFTIEFIVAVVVFLALMVYSLTFVTYIVPNFQSEHQSNLLKSKAYQISELLLFDSGLWDGTKFVRVGLASDYYMLNYTKMNWLNSECASHYEDYLLPSLGLKGNKVINGIVVPMNYYIKIVISNSTKTIVNCGPDVKYLYNDTTTVNIVRYAVDENMDVTKITLRLW